MGVCVKMSRFHDTVLFCCEVICHLVKCHVVCYNRNIRTLIFFTSRCTGGKNVNEG